MGTSSSISWQNESYEHCNYGQRRSYGYDAPKRKSRIRRIKNLDGLYKSNVWKIILNIIARRIKPIKTKIFDIYRKSTSFKQLKFYCHKTV
jgi:hypothetical protein